MTRVSHPQKATRRRWFGLSRNNRGSVLLLVMIAAPVAAALFFSLIELVLVSQRQSLVNRNMVSYSSVLDGVIDYTNYAIKNRWCMTSEWTKDTNCSITHPMNLERLSLDMSAITALRDLNSTNASFSAAGIALDQISTTIDISSVVSSHPLFNIVQNLTKIGKSITAIGITVKRVNNASLPRRGREAFLDVKVTLISGSIIFRNLSSISSTSRVMVTPRELNYFSLIVPRDLYLDGSNVGLATAQGDIGFPTGTGGKGVSFESPVFVNGDIHIPDTVASYTNVNFLNRVILGGSNGNTGGRLMRGSTLFSAPNNGNMSSYLYSVLPNFGGFKKGVDIDGVRDLGLDVLAGYPVTTTVVNSPDSDGAKQCIGVNNVYYKLSATKDSDLVMKPLPQTTPNEFRFLIGLTQGNMFVAQELRPYFTSGGAGKAYLTDTITGEQAGRLNGQATMFFRVDTGPANGSALGGTPTAGSNAYTMEFTLRPNSQATLKFPSTNGALASGTPMGKLDIQLVPVYVNNDTSQPMQMDVVELRVRTYQAQYAGTIEDFSIFMKAFDLGVFAGRDRRYPDTNSLTMGRSMEGWLHFQLRGGTPPTLGSANSAVNGTLYWVNPTNSNPATDHPVPTDYSRLDGPLTPNPVSYPGPTITATPAPTLAPALGVVNFPVGTLPNENYNYQGLVDACLGNSGGTNSAAFKSIGWNSPFVNSTRYSWHFAPHPEGGDPDTSYQSIPVGSPGQALTINNGTFYVNSIVSQCIIPASTTVAAGFLTCDQMIINPRGAPLLMIGTFIVGKLSVDPSAVTNGLTFRSIYHPQATSDLIAQGILKNKDGTACPVTPSFPIWWPNLSNTQYDSFRKCNVVSLRDTANPFTWTSVNPDCGLSGTSVQCQKHAINIILNEISRTSDLQ